MRSRPQQLTLCRSLHAEALQAIAGKGLAQGPYMAARAGFEPMTLRSNGVVSTNAPPCPIVCSLLLNITLHISLVTCSSVLNTVGHLAYDCILSFGHTSSFMFEELQ